MIFQCSERFYDPLLDSYETQESSITERRASVINELRKLPDIVSKVDSFSNILADKVRKFENSVPGRDSSWCDPSQVRELENKINVHSKKVDQFVIQNLRITKSISDEISHLNERMEILMNLK